MFHAVYQLKHGYFCFFQAFGNQLHFWQLLTITASSYKYTVTVTALGIRQLYNFPHFEPHYTISVKSQKVINQH